MNILERYKKPTPKFFRVLRNLGVSIATAAGTILAAPIMLPTRLLTIATYLLIIGTVVSAVSQAAVEDSTSKIEKEDQEDQEDLEVQEGQDGQEDSKYPKYPKDPKDPKDQEREGELKQKEDGY